MPEDNPNPITNMNNNGQQAEAWISNALTNRNYTFEKQVHIGKKLGNRKHVIDFVVGKLPKDKQILISVKWQQVSGTAEEKIPWEIICLQHACESFQYKQAYLVLGGTDRNKETREKGWTLRQFFISNKLTNVIKMDNVKVVSLDTFIAQLNKNEL